MRQCETFMERLAQVNAWKALVVPVWRKMQHVIDIFQRSIPKCMEGCSRWIGPRLMEVSNNSQSTKQKKSRVQRLWEVVEAINLLNKGSKNIVWMVLAKVSSYDDVCMVSRSGVLLFLVMDQCNEEVGNYVAMKRFLKTLSICFPWNSPCQRIEGWFENGENWIALLFDSPKLFKNGGNRQPFQCYIWCSILLTMDWAISTYSFLDLEQNGEKCEIDIEIVHDT